MTSFEESAQNLSTLLAREKEPEVDYGKCNTCPRLRDALASIANNEAFHANALDELCGKVDAEIADPSETKRPIQYYLGMLANMARFENGIKGRREDIKRLRENCQGIDGSSNIRDESDGTHTEITTIVCGSPSLKETNGELPYQEPVTVIRKKV